MSILHYTIYNICNGTIMNIIYVHGAGYIEMQHFVNLHSTKELVAFVQSCL